MIVKDRDGADHADGGRRGEAGAAAERQMAHYLRRAFGDTSAVSAVNDLRVAVPGAAGDFAQVDHLVIHRFGLVVVQSKSVHGTVAVNGAGEWTRTVYGRPQGMPSPIEQARRQAKVVRQVLTDRFDPLGGGVFARAAFDVLVAVSDGGIIDRGSADVPEACKADAVPGRVEEILAARGRGPKLFDGSARKRLVDHLVSLHTPVRAAAPTPPPAKAAVPPPAKAAVPPSAKPAVPPSDGPTCRACGGHALHAQYGRYGYYFRCLTCTANTPMPKGCPACGAAAARVRKDGPRFFTDCPACRRTLLIHVNVSLADLEGPA